MLFNIELFFLFYQGFWDPEKFNIWEVFRGNMLAMENVIMVITFCVYHCIKYMHNNYGSNNV